MSWPIVKLGEIFDITSSKRVHEIDWRNEGVPFYRAREVAVLAKEGRVDNDLFIDESMYEEFKAKYGVPKVGDLLVTAVGTLGKVYAVQESDRFYFKDASVIWLRARQEVDTSYIQHAMNSTDVQRFIQNSSGATVGTYTISRANETEIPLPPLPEQKRIAAILDKADAIRRKRQQAIQLADDFLRAVFLDMFGDPVTNPKGWPVKSLKDVSKKIGSGSTPRGGSEAYLEKGISLIRSLNIHDDDFRMKNLAFIDNEQAEKLSNVEVQAEDVLLNITGASVCRCAVVPAELLPARVNQHVCIIRPSDLINSSYLRHVLISAPYKQKLLRMSGAGATREALTKQQVESLEVPIPPKDLQNKFLGVKAKVRNLVRSSESFQAESIFESLSGKAFSGQL